MVQRRAVGGEELAELRVGGHMVALGQRREARGVPDPGGEPEVFGHIDGGEHAGQQWSHLIVLTARGQHGGHGEVGGASDGFHLLGGRDVAGLAGGGERPRQRQRAPEPANPSDAALAGQRQVPLPRRS